MWTMLFVRICCLVLLFGSGNPKSWLKLEGLELMWINGGLKYEDFVSFWLCTAWLTKELK